MVETKECFKEVENSVGGKRSSIWKHSDPNAKKYVKGTFEVIDGKLSLTFEDNAKFDEVKQATILLRDELNRLLDNEHKCPFHREA